MEDEFYDKYGFRLSLNLIDWDKVEKDGYYGLYSFFSLFTLKW
jgi:hypothetical protein